MATLRAIRRPCETVQRSLSRHELDLFNICMRYVLHCLACLTISSTKSNSRTLLYKTKKEIRFSLRRYYSSQTWYWYWYHYIMYVLVPKLKEKFSLPGVGSLSNSQFNKGLQLGPACFTNLQFKFSLNKTLQKYHYMILSSDRRMYQDTYKGFCFTFCHISPFYVVTKGTC